MERPYRHITVDREGDVHCVRLAQLHLSETDVIELSDELVSLIIDRGCRKLALSLGPESPECLYSIFLAKLVMVRRRLRECNGHMRLCEVAPPVLGIFEACRLNDYFEFEPTRQAAVASLAAVS
jgi:hypothetical protein